jgi:2-polyprenyl-3-methyl-5-hydroxy-6-metoxy-1,4-benzoquinol methylase
MKKEIIFNKYKTKSPDYHYKEINKFNIFNFNLFLFTRFLIVSEHIHQEIASRQNKKIIRLLDLGCGDGVLIYMLIKSNPGANIKIYGVDLDPLAITAAKKKNPNVEFVVSSVYKTPFSDGYFDFIVSSDVIEHLQYPSKMLLEIKRILTKAGQVNISTPIRLTEFPNDKMHVKEFFPDEFKNLLKKYFKSISIIRTHSAGLFFLVNRTVNIGRFKFQVFSYVFNLIFLLFGINLFNLNNRDSKDVYSYMLASCRK